MRILYKYCFVILILSFLMLAGCNSFNSIREDFEAAGYSYSEKANMYVEDVLEEFEEEDVFVKPHVFTKSLNVAIVLEFKSTKALEKELEDSATLQGLIEDMKKTDIVRGNCLLIPLGIYAEEMIDIFQGRYGEVAKQ